MLVVSANDPDNAGYLVGLDDPDGLNRYHYNFGSDKLPAHTDDVDDTATGQVVSDDTSDDLTTNSEVGELVGDNDTNAEVDAMPEGSLAQGSIQSLL